MVKPDGVCRGLVGEVISRIEKVGLKIVALKMVQLKRQQAEQLYRVHQGKPFYEKLISYVTSAPVVLMVVEGKDAITVVRKIIGATDPVKASPGTIRGDFSLSIERNVVHASDSKETADYEIGLFFSDEDFVSYERADEAWLY